MYRSPVQRAELCQHEVGGARGIIGHQVLMAQRSMKELHEVARALCCMHHTKGGTTSWPIRIPYCLPCSTLPERVHCLHALQLAMHLAYTAMMRWLGCNTGTLETVVIGKLRCSQQQQRHYDGCRSLFLPVWLLAVCRSGAAAALVLEVHLPGFLPDERCAAGP